MRAVRFARFRGVPLQMHWTFLLALPFFAWIMAGVWIGEAPPAWAFGWGVALAVGLFGSVLLHEMAHTAMALRLGVPVASITLLPIGGVSAFEKPPSDPDTEFKITVVGPLTNVVLAAPLLFAAWSGIVPDALPGLSAFVLRLGLLNVVLGGFNLLVPAFPMDGGRILRAVLERRIGRARATRIATAVGKGLAFAMGAFGVFSGAWLLVAIAVLVWLGATAEATGVAVEERLLAFRVEDVMTREVDSVKPDASVDEALAYMQATRHLVLPVVDADGHASGVVRLADLAAVVAPERYGRTAADVSREAPTLPPEAPASEAWRAVAHAGGTPLLVQDAGRLVGIVTPTDVARFAEIVGARGPV